MIKRAVKKSNGNVFKTVVRGVVREELVVVGEQIKVVRKELREGLRELETTLDEKLEATESRFDEKLDVTFRKYRDDVLTKMDEVVGELKTTREEQAAELMLHEELEERVESLESIHPQGQHPK